MEILEGIRKKIGYYWELVKRKDTPLISKVMLVLAIVYLLSPIDLIPDFIPIIGFLDDLIIVPGLIWLALKIMDESVETSGDQQ